MIIGSMCAISDFLLLNEKTVEWCERTLTEQSSTVKPDYCSKYSYNSNVNFYFDRRSKLDDDF